MRTQARTAVFLVGIMGILSIASAHVMTTLRSDAWLTEAVSQLVSHRSVASLEKLKADSRVVTNRANHALVRELWISSTGDPAQRVEVDMSRPEHREWAYAWIAAQHGQTIHANPTQRFLLKRQGPAVNVDRIMIAEIPRPRVTGPLLAAVILALLLWLGLVHFRGGRQSVWLGGTVFGLAWLGSLFWCIWKADEARRALYANGAPPDAIGDYSLVFAAALLPVVIAVVVGMIRDGKGSEHREAYGYLTPAVIGMLVLVFIPFLLGVALAFTRYDEGEYTWVGVANFLSILSNEGLSLSHPLSFYFTLGVTILWTAVNVCLHASIGLAMALLLNRPDLRFKAVYRVLLIIPWAVPSYITALVWHGMFDSTDGLINACIAAVGLAKIPWFDHFWTGFSANVITNTWLGFPFMMVVSLGALQSIPKDLYEAAEVDGATRWQSFKTITIPLLRPALMPAIILGAVWTFNMFNVIYLVSGGAPSNSTDILITEAYRWAFEKDRYGYAAAYSLIIFLILLMYSFVTQRLSRGDEVAA